MKKKRERETVNWSHQDKNVRQVIQVEGTACTEVIGVNSNSSFRELRIDGVDKGVQFSSVQLLRNIRLFATPWTAARQASCPSPTPEVYSNSCPLSW